MEQNEEFCISGDKAYPRILLPSSWQLYVTMTAEHEAISEVDIEDNGAASAFNIDNDERRFKSPEIAKFRSVVERVIGAIKSFKILLNVPFMSQAKHELIQRR